MMVLKDEGLMWPSDGSWRSMYGQGVTGWDDQGVIKISKLKRSDDHVVIKCL